MKHILCALLALSLSAAVYGQDVKLSYGDTLKQANEAVSKKDYEQAVKLFQQAAELAPNEEQKASASLRQSQALVSLKKLDEARAVLDKILELNVRSTTKADAYLQIGNILNQQQPEKALEIAEKLLALPDLPPQRIAAGQNLTGQSYMRQKKYTEARQAFGKITEMEGLSANTKADATLNIAQSWYYEKNYEEVRKTAEKVAAIDGVSPPLKSRALMMIADSYRIEKNTAAAKEAYQKVVDLPGVSENAKKAAQTQIDKLQ